MGRSMTARGSGGRVRLTISCSDLDWERSREIADRRGVSINGHMISAGLSVELDPEALSGPSLVLSGAEQRQLFDRVARMADGALAAAGPGGSSIERLRQSVELLLMTVLRDMVRQGREDELGPLLAETFGADHAPEIERQFHRWMENQTPLLG